jgi:plasmid stabilization system protein ParE
MRVRLHPAAEEERLDAALWLEHERSGTGERFLAAYESARDWLLQYRQIGPRVARRVRAKQLSGFPFAIVYVVEEDEIVVVAIAHHARRRGYWRERLLR